MINPYREARHALGLTQQTVADECGVTPQVVLRLEQGLFSAPPPGITDFFQQSLYSHKFSEDHYGDNIQQRYYSWVHSTRNTNGNSEPVIQAKKLLNLTSAGHTPDWVEFRKNYLGLSLAATAKLLVIQISLLQDFERSGRNKLQLQDILLDWGFPLESINWTHPRSIKERGQDIPA